ncbi:17332_t:CDS:2, partial [Acaulospora colombiana]
SSSTTTMRPVLRPTPTIPLVSPDDDWKDFSLDKRQDPPAVTDWNPRYALFVGDNDDGQVTLILRNAESDEQIGNWTQPNKLGRFSLAVDDKWWDRRAVSLWQGQPRNWTFYWQIIPSTHTINGGEARQPTFVVVQTALPNSYMSSSSASLISESLASVSRSEAAAESSSVQAAQQSRDAALQNSRNSSSFPPWAIALIAVLGVISIVSILTLFFVLLRGARRRRNGHKRTSMGSESPMMQAPGDPISPTAASTQGIGNRASSVLSPPVRNAPSIRYNDGGSINSRSISGGEGVITGSDAAIMADAFRKALRKPDFADRPQEEGESPEQNGANETEALLLNRELAEEGKNIRSVSSERGVKVVDEDDNHR